MAVKRKKKKQWIRILAPSYFNEKEIGETLVSEPEEALGRRLTISVVDLTEDYNKYYMKISFMINKVENSTAYTEFDGIECLADYISRMVLRRVTRIDVVQDLLTKDNVKLRVKSLVVVYRKVTRAIQKAIREKVEKMVENFVKNSTIEEFVKKVLNDEFKKKILSETRKIYPVRYFEFRKVEVKRS